MHDNEFATSFEHIHHKISPQHFLRSEIIHTAYDGESDDLLTGGLGAKRLADKTPPSFATPLRPTPAELRQRAIYTSYQALLDVSSDGGYGTLYGPTAPVTDQPIGNDGKIAGDEYLAYAAAMGGEPDEVVTVMVQILKTFDRDHPCLVTAPSSGSRGIYGAIATQVAAAVEEQSATTAEVSRNIAGVSDAARETGMAARAVGEVAVQINTESGRLRTEIGSFLDATRR